MTASVAVIGGGLGGLALAGALGGQDLEVTVYEAAPTARLEGQSLSLWSNGTSVLKRLGITPDGPVVERMILHAAGRPVTFQVGAMAAAIGSPNMTVRRAGLLEALTAAVGPGQVRYGKECLSVRPAGPQVVAAFADGTEVLADLVIGADGVHSQVRRCLWNRESAYAGTATWQGAASLPAEVPPAGDTILAVARRGLFGGAFRMPDGLVHWFVDHHQPTPKRPDNDRDHLEGLFAGWPAPFPSVVEASSEFHFVPIYTVRPPLRWSTGGNVALLGDAAHAMGPALGQGANQAFVDAVALAEALRKHGVTETALQHYERSRRRPALALWGQSQAALLLRRTGLFNSIGLLPDSLANRIFAQSIRP